MLKIIYYKLKTTAAGTEYTLMESDDFAVTQTKLIEMVAYFGELNTSKNPTVKLILKWWTEKQSTLPFSLYTKSKNSPQSFVCGLLNNTLFGTQRDFTVNQLEHLQNICSHFNQLRILVKEDLNIDLQKLGNTDTLEYRPQLFERG